MSLASVILYYPDMSHKEHLQALKNVIDNASDIGGQFPVFHLQSKESIFSNPQFERATIL